MKNRKPTGYWNNNRVIEEARKYTTKAEFKKSCPGAYGAAVRNNLFDEMEWLESSKTPYSDPIYSVYLYRFIDFNTVYIGLTMNTSRRNQEHRTEENSPVYCFAVEHGIKIPEMEILITGLYSNEAQLYEHKCRIVSEYIGFNTLNEAPTGVGIGSLGGCIKKWTKKTLLKEAMKYNSRSEFRNGSPSAYAAACNRHIIQDIEWPEENRKLRGYWSKERVFYEGRKYKTKHAFEEGCPSGYSKALKEKWIQEMDWFELPCKPNGYWNDKERVFEEARKYNIISDFKKNTPGAYQSAKKHGWLNEMGWFDDGRKKPRI